MNSTTAPKQVQLALSARLLNGEKLSSESRIVDLAANQSTELGQFTVDPLQQVVISAQLIVDGAIVARATLWPEPFKYLQLPDPQIEVTRLENDRLRLRAARPAKGVWLEAGDEVKWSDNQIDLIPGDTCELTAVGLGEQPVSIRWLGKGIP